MHTVRRGTWSTTTQALKVVDCVRREEGLKSTLLTFECAASHSKGLGFSIRRSVNSCCYCFNYVTNNYITPVTRLPMPCEPRREWWWWSWLALRSRRRGAGTPISCWQAKQSNYLTNIRNIKRAEKEVMRAGNMRKIIHKTSPTIPKGGCFLWPEWQPRNKNWQKGQEEWNTYRDSVDGLGTSSCCRIWTSVKGKKIEAIKLRMTSPPTLSERSVNTGMNSVFKLTCRPSWSHRGRLQ